MKMLFSDFWFLDWKQDESGNTLLMTDEVLFEVLPSSAYLYGEVGSNVCGGWCGTSSRMEPRTLAGGQVGELFHIPTLQVREDPINVFELDLWQWCFASENHHYILNNEEQSLLASVCRKKF